MSLANPEEGLPGADDPGTIIERGCETNDIPTVAQGLELAAEHGSKSSSMLSSALRSAVRAGNTAVARYLTEKEHVSVADLSPLTVSKNASPELLQLVIDHGFDINEPADLHLTGGVHLLQRLCHNEVLVRWCLDHGARVDDMVVDPYYSPPLLELVACLGTVSTFALLLAKGAKLEGRILHFAAGNVGCSPGTGPEKVRTRMDMVRYLVDDVGLDVNAIDSEECMPNFWGTPICYAAKNPYDHIEVVRFLLDRGADPQIKERMNGYHDAFSYAKEAKNPGIQNVLEEWKLKHEKQNS